MTKPLLVLMLTLLSLSAQANHHQNNNDNIIHGSAFKGSTTLPTNPNDGGQLPGCNPSGGQPNKCDPVAPPVPIPGAIWMMVAGLVGMLGISRRK